MADHFQVVPLAELVHLMNHAPRNWKRQVALTFDDGLRNNLVVAYPLLKALGLPATFFVCPGLIDRKQWLWNHECRARLNWLNRNERQIFAKEVDAPDEGSEQIVAWMKALALGERQRIEMLLRQHTPRFEPTEQQHQDYDMMSWADLRSLDVGLITIGAHTVNHNILTTLSPTEQEKEIQQSQAWLAQELGRPVTQFCYPNGSLNQVSVQCVRRHFELAVTTEVGPVEPGCAPCLIPRIPIAASPHYMTWRMYRPGA